MDGEVAQDKSIALPVASLMSGSVRENEITETSTGSEKLENLIGADTAGEHARLQTEHAVENEFRKIEQAEKGGLSVTGTTTDDGQGKQGAKIQLLDEIATIQNRIAQGIEDFLTDENITCQVTCEMNPTLKDRLQEGRRIIPEDFIYQTIYEQVIQRDAEFRRRTFLKQQQGERNIAKAQQDAAHADEVQERDNQERLWEEEKKSTALKFKTEESRIEMNNAHQRKIRESAKAEAREKADHDIAVKEEESRKRLEEASIMLKEKKQLIQNRLEEVQLMDEELTFLEKEQQKSKLEGEAKLAAVELEQAIRKLEIEVAERQVMAENFMEYERQKRLFEILPQLITELNRNSQTIEHLSIMQIDSPSDGERSEANGYQKGGMLNPAFQMAQSIHFLKEMLKLFNSPQL